MVEENPQKPHGGWKFCGLCIGDAWTESREKFGLVVDILLAVSAVLLVAFAWYSKHHPRFNPGEENERVSYWFAVIPVGLWILWFFYHYSKAAHKIYLKEANARISENEANDKTIKTLKEQIDGRSRIQKAKDTLGDCRRLLTKRIGEIHALEGHQLPYKKLDPETWAEICFIHESLKKHFSGADAEYFLSSTGFTYSSGDPNDEFLNGGKQFAVERLRYYASQLDKLIEKHIDD